MILKDLKFYYRNIFKIYNQKISKKKYWLYIGIYIGYILVIYI